MRNKSRSRRIMWPTSIPTDSRNRRRILSREATGVRPVVRKDDSAGPTVLSDRGHGPTQVELSNVNLADEAVTQIIAQRGFEANISTLRTADDMLGTILDMKR